MQQKEFRGLFIADIPVSSINTDPNAYSRLLGKSHIFKENLNEYRTKLRPSSSKEMKPKRPKDKIKMDFRYMPHQKLEELAIQYKTFEDFNNEMESFAQKKVSV
jgi:hypothetical protein